MSSKKRDFTMNFLDHSRWNRVFFYEWRGIFLGRWPSHLTWREFGIPWSQQVQRWLDPLDVSPGSLIITNFQDLIISLTGGIFWLVHVRFCGIPVSIHVRCNGRKRLATGSNNSSVVPRSVPTMRPFTNKTIANRAEKSKDITHLIAFSEGSVLKL